MANPFTSIRRCASLIRADLRAAGMRGPRAMLLLLCNDSLGAVVLMRMMHLCVALHLKPLAHLIKGWNKMLHGIDVSLSAQIGPGLRVPHSVGIVVGPCTMGRYCKILQNVTIGKTDAEHDGRSNPVLGDYVTLYAGAVVIGPISVGRGVEIGANSVVTKDMPEGSIVAGVPARVLRRVDGMPHAALSLPPSHPAREAWESTASRPQALADPCGTA